MLTEGKTRAGLRERLRAKLQQHRQRKAERIVGARRDVERTRRPQDGRTIGGRG
jgi:hypothetical protein